MSKTWTPKQREIRTREHRILQIARPMVRDGGLQAIRVDAIADQMRLTRGTIYNHFPNREEIILAVAAQGVARRLELFRFAAACATASRDRIAAIGIACEVYAEQLPDDFAVEHLVRHDSVWDRGSVERREQLAGDERRCMTELGKIIDDAERAGDLKTTRHHSSADVLYGLWSLIYGGLSIAQTSPSLSDVGIKDHLAAIRRNCNAILDGVGWLPLYDPVAYRKLLRSIRPKLVAKATQLGNEPAVTSEVSS